LAPRLALRSSSQFVDGDDFSDIDRDGKWISLSLTCGAATAVGEDPSSDAHALPKQIGVIDDRPQMQRNTMFLNRGDGPTRDRQRGGIDASDWSWSSIFLDVDLMATRTVDRHRTRPGCNGFRYLGADKTSVTGAKWHEEFKLFPKSRCTTSLPQ